MPSPSCPKTSKLEHASNNRDRISLAGTHLKVHQLNDLIVAICLAKVFTHPQPFSSTIFKIFFYIFDFSLSTARNNEVTLHSNYKPG